MRVAIIGAGPAGLFAGSCLAARGHDVVAVDRDPGPPPDGHWPRRGVMQFHHAHGFRAQVAEGLQQEWPAAYTAWMAAGAVPVSIDVPRAGPLVVGHHCRRETFERALRTSAEQVPRLQVRQGHVDGVSTDHGRVCGLVVDGSTLPADLVLDASGRSGHAVDGLRAPTRVGGLCGMAYVDRQYQLHDPHDRGPMSGPVAWQADLPGYQAIIFPHEHGYFSVLLVRPTSDAALKGLRHRAAFEAACRAIPGLDEWTDPARSSPVTEVLPGGPLRNAYRGQRGVDGRAVPGLVSVGDAVATTTPTFGRGLATTFLQVVHLMALLDHGTAPDQLAEEFDGWCEQNMLPWVLDHLHMDGELVRRWEGIDVDLDRPLPSDLVLAAVEQDPRIGAAAGPYLTMRGLPSCLDQVEPLAHAVYATGWRPAFSPGPSRAELVDLIADAIGAGKDSRSGILPTTWHNVDYRRIGEMPERGC
jgi:2-polyprenyl-6-methoxyphenol hydroxylase-like FAD-dependent oxidoreductase